MKSKREHKDRESREAECGAVSTNRVVPAAPAPFDPKTIKLNKK